MAGSRYLLRWLLALGLVFGVIRPALAEEQRNVSLAFAGCTDADAREVRRLVEIDLSLVANESASNRLLLECRSDSWRIRVVATQLSRSLDLSSTARSARARLAAIVVEELVTEAAAGPDVKQAATVVPVSTPVPAPPVEDRIRTRRPARTRVGVLGGGRTLLGGVPRLLGVALRVEELRHPWSVDLMGERGSVSTSAGLVSLSTLSGGFTLSWRRSLGDAQVGIGAGARAGVVWMQGQPSDSAVRGADLVRGWAGPMANCAVVLPIAGRAAFELVVESGFTLLPVYGLVDGKREAALRGAWLGAQVGLAYAL